MARAIRGWPGSAYGPEQFVLAGNGVAAWTHTWEYFNYKASEADRQHDARHRRRLGCHAAQR